MVSGPTMWISFVVLLPLVTLQLSAQERVKKSCSFGYGSHGCKSDNIHNKMLGYKQLSSFDSPGKRELGDGYQAMSDDELARLLQNLREQMSALSTLRLLTGEVNRDGEHIQEKRTCNFGLGNHCETEALDRAANMYYYLKSFSSPGRRRRAVAEDSNISDSLEEGEEDVVAQKRRR